MAVIPPASPNGAVIVDASVAVAIAAREVGNAQKADGELRTYTAMGYELFAPGVLVTEVLYVLCKREESGVLLPAAYAQAVQDFLIFAGTINPSSSGDIALASRASAIGGGYSCRSSADGVYVALAEALSQTRPAVLITFDQDMPKQAARNAPGVTVKLIA